MSLARVLDLDLVPALAAAVDAQQLELRYQPEIDLASGAVVGMEALLRWLHPERGLLYPADFLPVASSSAALARVGRWVLEQAVAEAARWQPLPGPGPGPCRRLWVNVDAEQLLAAGFVENLQGLLERARVPAAALGLDLPAGVLGEGVLGETGGRVRAVLADLHELGVGLAVDDVGTWYATLGPGSADLPVDAVKLDRRFVRGVGSDLCGDGIVAAVIDLAHERGLYVVAEGVESWTEGARLCELGCDRAHGYLFSAPQRSDRARWMLAKGAGWRGSFVADTSVAALTALAGPR